MKKALEMRGYYAHIPEEDYMGFIFCTLPYLNHLERIVIEMLLFDTTEYGEPSQIVTIRDVATVTGKTTGDILIAFGNVVNYGVGMLSLDIAPGYDEDETDSILLVLNNDWTEWKFPNFNYEGDVEMNKEVKEMAKQIIGQIIDSGNPNINVFYRDGLLEVKDIDGHEDGVDFSENLHDIEPEYMAEEVGLIAVELEPYLEHDEDCENSNEE